MELPDIDEENAKLSNGNDLPDIEEENASVSGELPDIDEENRSIELPKEEPEMRSNVPGLTDAIKAQGTDESREGIRIAGMYQDGLLGKGKKYLGRQNGEDMFEYDAENAPAFAPQDDEGKSVHERVKAHKGGTLDHFSRPMRINRNKDGKAESYSTTASTVVEELDGTFSVIPTMWRGENGEIESAIDDQDAARHYRETERGKVGQKVGDQENGV